MMTAFRLEGRKRPSFFNQRRLAMSSGPFSQRWHAHPTFSASRSRARGAWIAVISLCLCGLAASARAAAADPRPNIVFIFADDHAAHAMSCYGSRINTTPNLDRIATGGMLFHNCFCTNSICGPSRAVVLTGKHSHKNGFKRNGDRFDGSQPTFPKMLQKAGYQTAIFGKWHLASDPTGFDVWKILIGLGTYYNPVLIENGKHVPHTGYVTDLITDLALDYLKHGRDPHKPFLLMYHHRAPHREWDPNLKHLHLYDDVTIPEPDNLFDDYQGRGTAAHVQQMEVVRDLKPRDLKFVPPKELNAEQLRAWNAAYGPKNEAFRAAHLTGTALAHWKYQRYIKDYLRCVASLDENVGRLLDYLDESGLSKNTVVIYSSDQGFFLGDHGWFDKRFMYEEAYRQPLLVRWPGVTQAGSRSDALVSNLDFAETFLAIAGLPVPHDMQGQSLAPLLAGRAPAHWRKSLYYHYYDYPAVHMVNKHEGVRTARYKLLNFYELGEWELYDLEKDPHEMHSVFADPAYASVAHDMQHELARLREVYEVPPIPLVNHRANRTQSKAR
jgi:arylsulfatase A-like enzyme